ncbi:hypothetical protein QR685DRAFT_604300 [Neurospora intermedia]|uniref:Shugoshin C-terminal domain-containing protein n=1 Tax=Neurospora intermedia TaxID=5142 RepID=A0ABR3DN19_NEUIN
MRSKHQADPCFCLASSFGTLACWACLDCKVSSTLPSQPELATIHRDILGLGRADQGSSRSTLICPFTLLKGALSSHSIIFFFTPEMITGEVFVVHTSQTCMRTTSLNIKPITKMSDKRPLPETPRPSNSGNARITDYFKSIERTGNDRKSKRELGDEEVDRPTKKFKQRDDGHASSIKTARYQIKVDNPKARKPASARLLDETDGGLHDSLVGRRDFLEEERVEDKMRPRNANIERGGVTIDADDTARLRRPKAPSPRLSIPRSKKKFSSARLLDETDGGLNAVLTGRFETTRYEEPMTGDDAENPNHTSKYNGLIGEPTTTENNNIDATPRGRLRRPSPQRPPTTPQRHSNQRQEEHNSSPISPNDSP